ncbi:ankyrin repeat domain-containing protein [Streptomyces caatingaensis]|uniref:Uncharacterized protein n=1 Tax=Streptomyces caatingaensis TaxID=1678637 RepID=A0A0K9XHU7_9ACTN|nr:ankyrin repeat domain-containing protein [Streptomyces caatingaensis]KNB52853.1 hypothetical protein AC230_09460 [Streptomyces caatingaensis]
MDRLLTAIDACDHRAAAEETVRPDEVNRRAEDGRTPLLRAVDRGANDIVGTLLRQGADPRLSDAAGRDALALARYWRTAGAEDELRRRTGSSETVRRTSVQDAYENVCTELSLGGLAVRDTHTAILTELEPAYGITQPFAELLGRAVTGPGVQHPAWQASLGVLHDRHDPAVWDEAAALRDRTDPLERYFGAELMRTISLFDESEESPFDGPLVDLFLA